MTGGDQGCREHGPYKRDLANLHQIGKGREIQFQPDKTDCMPCAYFDTIKNVVIQPYPKQAVLEATTAYEFNPRCS